MLTKFKIINSDIGVADERSWICLLGIIRKSRAEFGLSENVPESGAEITFFTLDEGVQENKRVAFHGDITLFQVSPYSSKVVGLNNVYIYRVNNNKPVIFVKDSFFYIPYYGKEQFAEAFVYDSLLSQCERLAAEESKNGYYYENLCDMVDELQGNFLVNSSFEEFRGIETISIPYVLFPFKL